MTKKIKICKICNREVDRCHDYEEPESIANHIKYAHPHTAKRLGELHRELEKLQNEFREISGRYARESFYYRIK